MLKMSSRLPVWMDTGMETGQDNTMMNLCRTTLCAEHHPALPLPLGTRSSSAQHECYGSALMLLQQLPDRIVGPSVMHKPKMLSKGGLVATALVTTKTVLATFLRMSCFDFSFEEY